MVRRFPWQCSVGSLSRINYHLNYTPISYVVILFTYICYHTRDIAAGAHCHNGMVTHIFVYPGYVNTNYRTSAARAHRLDILSHAFKVQINMCHPYNNNESFEFCLHKHTYIHIHIYTYMHIHTHTYTHTYHVYYVVSLLENSEKSNFFTCLLNVPIEHGIKYNSLYLFAKIGPCTSIEFSR